MSMWGLPEKIILFDTEFTSWEGSMTRDWSGEHEFKELVQIGAVLFDTHALSEVDTLNVYVRPTHNPLLSDYFVRLTGITQDIVDTEGVDMEKAIMDFAQWVEEYDLYSFGGDRDILDYNCTLIGMKFPFELSRFYDIRTLFVRNGIPANDYMSSTILNAFGKESPYTGHNAFSDARTIALALHELGVRVEKS